MSCKRRVHSVSQSHSSSYNTLYTAMETSAVHVLVALVLLACSSIGVPIEEASGDIREATLEENTTVATTTELQTASLPDFNTLRTVSLQLYSS